jgi:class 3 adenylate cyclase/tetratricopeptide (TPR) repeat protein
VVTCPACSAPNDDDARFCSSCGTALAKTCPSCGSPVPPQARFCPTCGTALTTSEGGGAAVEERRLLSVLFADLAGFTERSDQADPEDVRRILVPFHAVAKEEIERFGGTLDKFIGDAAMGVFGAPIAHEDDAERAVRSALSIRDRVLELEMPVRIAVNSGEALVTFGEGPQIGERVAGDVVNTASRLQSIAPRGGVVVGLTTQRATRGVISYQELPDVTVKGKAEPLGVWLAEAVRPTEPERDEDDPPPFVGRDGERSQLRELLSVVLRSRAPHLVTVVGEPGIGKTRLVGDLADQARAQGMPVVFRRGRCLPYGERITYAPLEDIVRASIGVAPGQGRGAVVEALTRALAELDPGTTDRDWLSTRIAALVAPGGDEVPAERAESFAAWTRFLELEAEHQAQVLLVEDLHWADPAMLEFIEHLAEQAGDVPLLLLCTTRPELFARHPSWGSGMARATTISLSPLPDEAMHQLLGALLLHSVLPPESGDALTRRAGGNPLYAREFVHMLEDSARRPLAGGAAADEAPSVSVPDTVQALIAARLDALDPADRSLLQAASVVGNRFWPAAVVVLDPDAGDIDASLRELQRRGLIRRSSLSTIADHTEYSFSHALIRDVAYGRLPRATRARMHLRISGWLEDSAGDDLLDRADMLASHATRALELARAAELREDLPEFERRALRFLVMAGERQIVLDAGRAADHFEQALALATHGGAERADILRQATSLGWRSGRLTSEQAVDRYRESIDLALEAGDQVLAAQSMRRLYFQLGLQGETTAANEALDRAIELLEAQDEPGEHLAELYACRAEAATFAGHSEEALRWAERALSLPRTQTVTLMALHLRGDARCSLGDLDGLEDLREALKVAQGSDVAMDIIHSSSYLSEWVGLLEGPIPALVMNADAIDLCDRRGIRGQGMWARAERLWLLFDAGQWDELMELADVLRTWADEHGDVQVGTVARLYRARVLAHRRQLQEAEDMVAQVLPAARQIEDLQILSPALVAATVTASVAGRHDEVLALIREFDELTRSGPAEYREVQLPEVVRACLLAGDLELARSLADARDSAVARVRLAVGAAQAAVSEAVGSDEDAARQYEELIGELEERGLRFELAQALAGKARCLRSLDRVADAEASQARATRLLTDLRIPEPGRD